MPEFGKHAFYIYASYASTFAILGGLIAWSLWRNARVRRALEAVEAARRTSAGTPAPADDR